MTALLQKFFPTEVVEARLFWRGLVSLVGLALLLSVAGCAKSESELALETDANGYLCQNCQAKFYTERKVFADICPSCKSMKLSQVVGFVCPDDSFLTVGPRAGGFVACGKCRKTVSGLAIPHETDLKAWGAAKKSKTEVGGG